MPPGIGAWEPNPARDWLRLTCWQASGCDSGTYPARTALLRRGLALEYVTLDWNIAGVIVLAFAAVAARSVALAGFGLDWLIEVGASTVVIWAPSGTGEQRQRLGLRLIGYAFAALAVYLLAPVHAGPGHEYQPATLGARDHLDRRDRGGHVRLVAGKAGRRRAGQSRAADRGSGHADRRDPGRPGLTVVSELATAHGGTAEAASQPGHGAIFTIRLPSQVS